VLMCLTASQILFSYVGQPFTLNKNYLRFLQEHGAKDLILLRAIEDEFRRKPQLVEELFRYCQVHGIAVPDDIVHIDICYLLHPHQGSIDHFFRFWLQSFRRSLVLYAPLHSLWALFRLVMSRKKLMQSGHALHQLYSLLQNIFRSAAFLSAYCSIAWLMLCFTAMWQRSTALAKCMQLAPGLGLLFEHPSRRLEVALYCAPRALESFYRELLWFKKINRIPNDALLLCCVSLGVLHLMIEKYPTTMRSGVRSTLQWLWQ